MNATPYSAEEIKAMTERGMRTIVQILSSQNSGRCYHETKWRVTTYQFLDEDSLKRIVPSGQVFKVTSIRKENSMNVYDIDEATDSSD